MLKKLKRIVLIVVVLVVVGVVAAIWNVNSIVRAAVEKGAGATLDLPTSLGGARVGLLTGDVSLSELKLGSPAGFSAPEMFTLGNVDVDTSYGKLFGNPTQIETIRIEKPKLVLEFKGLSSNIKALADSLTPPQTIDPTATVEPVAPGQEVKKLIIGQLSVKDAQVIVTSDLPILPKPIEIAIPPIVLNQVGNADGNRSGEEMDRIISELIARLTSEAAKSGKIPPELAAIVQGDLTNLGGKIGGAVETELKKVTQQIDQIGEKATEAIDKGKNKLAEETDKLKDKLNFGKKDEPK
jgi:uncharacterized protein involved in outer membrane biogenesis